MASKIESHGPEDTRRLTNYLPYMQSINSVKTTAVTDDKQQKRTEALQKSPQNNEIIRIAYLLHVNGAKFNFEYLPVKGKVPIGLDGYYLKDWDDKKFSIKECLSAKGATGIGVKCGLHLLCVDFDGASAFDLASEEGINWPLNTGWEVRRDDEPWRIKQLFTPTREQIALLPNGEFQGKVATRKAVKDDDGNVIKKGEALEFFLTHKRQVVIHGKHPDGGNYFWPKSNQPEILKPLEPPKDEIWNFVLKLAKGNKKPLKKSNHYSGKTKRLNPCPICGRHNRLWCEETSDGLIFCMVGNTFSAEQKHGRLEVGSVVNGYTCISKRDECLTFKVHRPIKPNRRIKGKLLRAYAS